MSRSKLPALAAWLLEHLVARSMRDALTGDLQEEFARRGSAAWLWRQVLMAMVVGFFRKMRSEWAALCYAALWAGAYDRINHFIFQRFFLWKPAPLWVALSWPWSLICEEAIDLSIAAGAILCGYCGYLWLTVRFSRAALLKESALS